MKLINLRRKTLDTDKVKELITDILLDTILDSSECQCVGVSYLGNLRYRLRYCGEIQRDEINIYEFAFRCKSYFIEINYFLETRYIPDFDKFRCIIHHTSTDGYENIEVGRIPLADTEVEVILEASNWILENK